MSTRFRPATLLLAAALAAALAPNSARAQVCMGMPLEWGPNLVAGEYSFHDAMTLYRARVGRDLGEMFSAIADYSQSRAEEEAHAGLTRWKGTGHAVGGTLVYRLVQLDLPLCSFASLRHARSTISSSYWYDLNSPAVEQTVERSGTTALVGAGTGVELPISANVALIPFGTAQVGWTRATFRFDCSQQDYYCGYSEPEGLIHLEGEVGMLLRFRRLFLSGSYRHQFGDGNPLVFTGRYGYDEFSLLTLGLGLVF